MRGDSGGDLVLDTRVGFAICYIISNEEFSINDFGIYGANIILSGMSNVGIVGHLEPKSKAYLNNILITKSSDDQQLINQI